jgi:PEP-CTERM motif
MNFKLKALVATAVATITMSGAANALTNNEMFLVAYDSTNFKTFVAALGDYGSTTGFAGTATQARSFAADANWTSFITGASPNVAYQVLGFNFTGAGGFGAADKLLFTTNNLPSGNILTNQQMTNLSNDPASQQFQTLNALATGTGTTFVTGTGLDSGANVNTNVFTKVINVADTTAALGTNLNFYALTRPANGSVSNPVQMARSTFVGDPGLADYWNLSATGALTYTNNVAAVPEADTWAMMMLGLGFMGFVSRRRA